jgi:hypothetical protein
LLRELLRLADHFSDGRRTVTPELKEARMQVLGRLRHMLASVCIDALEPDLVILDEFQRFRDLLDGESEAAMLAKALFEYQNARVLLLSATPYRMLSLDHEYEDDHYPDFLNTLRFLHGDDRPVEKLKGGIARYRSALYRANDTDSMDAIGSARHSLEQGLREVMCRTERVGTTRSRDAMLAEPPIRVLPAAADLLDSRLLDQVGQALGTPDAVEYWKSSPYTLSFLRNYKLRERLEEASANPPLAVIEALRRAAGRLLSAERLNGYEALDAGNARMRCLFADTLDLGLWRLLWMPPSLPYSRPAGVYRDVGDVTKSLVFSSWSLVPDAVASLCSYEAERRMVEGVERRHERDKLYEQLRPLLRFARDTDGRLTGMPALARLYPSPSLAASVDPLSIALTEGDGGPVSRDRLQTRAETILRPLMASLVENQGADGRGDERWYWAAPALLDLARFPGVAAWCRRPDGWRAAMPEEEHGQGFVEHVAHLVEAIDGRLDPPLGTQPADLVQVMAELALAGPGVCVLRALSRVKSRVALDDGRLLCAAVRGAGGFRTLFNMPESIALLRGLDAETPYWRTALHYAIDGNLQAVLDEYVHVLQESLGLVDAPPDKRLDDTATALADALSIRTAQVRLDEYRVSASGHRIEREDVSMRCRFALRFGELKDDKDATLARADVVRTAFNSPFRPFVLASTSIGQEGLDFHTWCHAVMHWNLPSNPVDLEQREGRVHRYKGHAVRKNIARDFGLAALRKGTGAGGEPWAEMFALAVAARDGNSSDLVPYWLYETDGGARIERRIPLIPFSREVEQLARLRRGLALYRLVFGQPRQEDLLTYLSEVLPEGDIDRVIREWQIDLSP